jgi:DNA-binding transcriptional regulator YiaG
LSTITTGTLRPRERDALRDLRQRRAEPLPTPAERRAIREAAGVAVEELAAVVGVSPAAVYTWEVGTRTPGRKVRDKYAAALALLRGDAE